MVEIRLIPKSYSDAANKAGVVSHPCVLVILGCFNIFETTGTTSR